MEIDRFVRLFPCQSICLAWWVSGFGVRTPCGAGPGTNPIVLMGGTRGFPTICRGDIASRMKRMDPEMKARALAIEYWLAAIVLSGAFVAGVIAALPHLLDG